MTASMQQTHGLLPGGRRRLAAGDREAVASRMHDRFGRLWPADVLRDS